MSHDRDKPDSPVTNRLVDAVRQMRIASADRSDVVVEMREATRTRLELLAEDLEPVIADIPADDDRFDFALTSGLQPRFWIDAVAHVMMGGDRRTYRFVRDTRLGRVVLAESEDRAVIADRVITYIAMRIHERDLTLAGDVTSYRHVATGRSRELESAEERRRAAQRPLDRISEALAILRQEARQEQFGDDIDDTPPEPARREPKKAPIAPVANTAPAPAENVAPAPAAPVSQAPSVFGQAQSIANAVAWVLIGIVIGAGVLLLAFQNLLVQQ